MSDASPKRWRQEPGHRVDHHPLNHNNLEDYEDLVVTRMPKKGMNVNAETVKDETLESEQVNKFASLPYILACNEPGYLNAFEIKVHQLEYGMDNIPTCFLCNETHLRITPSQFRASVTVEIPPIPAGSHYQVGWIHVITDLKSIVTYGEDLTCSSEIPELFKGTYSMLNAGRGIEFPWYSGVTNFEEVNYEPTFVPMSIDVNIFADVRWRSGTSKHPNLTYVYKKQRFYTFIAIKDVDTNICQIIETITWSSEYAVDVDPNKPLEERAKLLGPHDQEIPKLEPLCLMPPLDDRALNPPVHTKFHIHVMWTLQSQIPTVLQVTQRTSTNTNVRVRTREALNEITRKVRIKHSRNNDGDDGVVVVANN